MPNTNNTSYPRTEVRTVTIKRKNLTTRLPEVGTTVSTATYYKEKIGGAFANRGSKMPLGRQVLTKEQEDAWFPSIIGIAPNHTEWNKYLDQYWNDLSVDVPYDGLTLNCNITYQNADDKVGMPEVVTDYILWKYCLRYGDVANKQEDMHKSNKIRFYIWSKEEEVNNARTQQRLIDKAHGLRIALSEEPSKVEAMIVLFKRALPTTSEEQYLLLAELQKQNPAEFVTFATDEKMLQKARIQSYIDKGLLISPVNSTSIFYDDKLIGSSYSDVLAWINHPDNAQTKASLAAAYQQSR